MLMISHEEIKGLVSEWGLREEVIEKDYVIGWVLWGISTSEEIKKSWVFKGGTALKKCYIDTYRFSEDLDFSVLPNGPVKPEELEPIINNILARVYEESGIDFSIKKPAFKYYSHHHYTEGSIYYRGPRGAHMPSRIKLDITGKEKVVRPSVLRSVSHSYSDDLPKTVQVRCYSFDEIFAEKIRAMGQRGRPRDLYDIIKLFWREDLQAEPAHIKKVLQEKCAHKNISVPTFESIENSPNKDELISEWKNMLAHQLQVLPSFEEYWEELPKLFDWINGVYKPQPLSVISNDGNAWTPPPTMWVSGTGLRLEPIRFAAVNHLCVELEYMKQGAQLKRYLIEPYSLRRTKDNNLVLHAIRNDNNGNRAFRVDWIRKIKVSSHTFRPRYKIEFASTGTIGAKPTERKS
ncbi:MAG: nucleotidyl transferase AbiEii/AbiGii toxin family protein, partial [Candidatus Heimdallarchaeota archaeon]|nr:nucleotidyl transferase AbiEii/AbiGii toxin family protein [Candidatus Heimdallarchaeota archaeon]